MRLPAFVSRAAGVQQEKPVFVLQPGDVRMAEDNGPSVGKAPFHARPAASFGAGVVDHGYPDAGELELLRFGQPDLRWIQVSPDGFYMGVVGELIEKPWIHQVSGVQDQVCLLQVRVQSLREGFRAAGDVGVGEDYGEHASMLSQNLAEEARCAC